MISYGWKRGKNNIKRTQTATDYKVKTEIYSNYSSQTHTNQYSDQVKIAILNEKINQQRSPLENEKKKN